MGMQAMKRHRINVNLSESIFVKMVMTIKYGASKRSILSLLKELAEKHGKGIDTKKYCGKIKLKKDPLKIQKELRDEWN